MFLHYIKALYLSIISLVVVRRVTKEVDADSREAKSFLKEEKALEEKEEQSVSSEPQPSVPLSSGSRYHLSATL